MHSQAKPLPRIDKEPRYYHFRSSTAFITFTIAFAVFTEQWLYAVVVPVVPFALEERIHIPADRVQYWVAILLAIYGAASFISSPPWGWWSDRNQSRRLPFLIGLILMLASTMLLWFVRTATLMVIGRILQGVASTVIWTTGLAIMVDVVGEAQIGEYMGYIGIALNLGTLTGPMLGGIVFAKAGYHAVFSMSIAVVSVDVLLRLLMLDKHTPAAEGYGEIELEGSESVESHGLLKAAAHDDAADDIEAGKIEKTTYADGSDRPSSSNSLDSSDIAPQDMPPASRSFKDRLPPVVTILLTWRCASALWGVFVQTMIYASFQAVLPLVLHDIFHWESTGAGLIFLAMIVPGLFGPLAGMLSDRVGPRWPATIGFAILSPSLILLRYIDENTLGRKIGLCVLLFIVGIALTLILEPLMAEITYLGGENHTDSVAQDGKSVGSYAQAYALFNAAWSLGDTVGPLWSGFMVESVGWKTLTWTLGLLAGVSIVPQVLMCGGWLFAKRSNVMNMG